MGIVGMHPAVFVRVANKGVAGYGTWRSVQHIENKGFANALCARKCLTTCETCDEVVRHPAVFAKADFKGVTGVTVRKCGIQRTCSDPFFVTVTKRCGAVGMTAEDHSKC